MIDNAVTWWIQILYRRAFAVLLVAGIITVLAIKSMMSLSVSTHLEALMPQGAKSVQTLNDALKKTGSFASIQIVVHSDDPKVSLDFVKQAKLEIDQYKWVGSSQYYEDIDVLEEHKLLLLNLEELEQLEKDINQAYPTLVAQELAEIFGTNVTFTLRENNLSGNSDTVVDTGRIEEIQTSVSTSPVTQRLFTSEDGLTAILVVWPKPGLESLTDSKRMVDEAQLVVDKLMSYKYGQNIEVGVAGRIANKVAQFDTIVADLKLGLLSAIILISILIIWSYRTAIALPVILIPLVIGIIWTLGMTAITVGSLNLITVFLTLILFGLGIDYGIHNFSRYREERRKGADVEAALGIVMRRTGSASFIAALTTSLAFFSLTLTQFRAFTEFGVIAGMGVILIFISMYSILPALLVVAEKLGWKASRLAKSQGLQMGGHNHFNPLKHRRLVIGITLALVVFAGIFAPKMQFEKNIKNLEAAQPADLIAATEAVRRVFPDGHDRAIVVVQTQAELIAIDAYFKKLIADDVQTPTIKKISSLLDFIPSTDEQTKRLAVIHRLAKFAQELKGIDEAKYISANRYLDIESLRISDLPEALRRTYLGTESEPGYLLYIYNSVSMDDSRLAKQFYDDAANFTVGEHTYYSASEGFIFVEMLALMKADALKAIILVTLTIIVLVFFLVRSIKGTVVIILPPLIGVVITVGIMGAFGPSLSIMNMVILPSLVGISVDNSIHIFHRYKSDLGGKGDDADILNIMNTTGRAAVLTTFTTLIGFGGMITASMGGLRSMGALAIIGFLSCLLMIWILLPILLQTYRRFAK